MGVAQGVLTGIALAIAGLPSALLLGLCAAFASIVPVAGAALVWIPAGLYLIFAGTIWKGVFVLVWGVAVVSAADNIIRPWIVGGKVQLHPLVLVFSILGGVQAFGFLGLFLGPVIASVLSVLLGMIREEVEHRQRKFVANDRQQLGAKLMRRMDKIRIHMNAKTNTDAPVAGQHRKGRTLFCRCTVIAFLGLLPRDRDFVDCTPRERTECWKTVIQPDDPADSFGKLLRLPRPRSGRTEGRTAIGPRRVCLCCARKVWSGDHSGKSGQKSAGTAN